MFVRFSFSIFVVSFLKRNDCLYCLENTFASTLCYFQVFVNECIRHFIIAFKIYFFQIVHFKNFFNFLVSLWISKKQQKSSIKTNCRKSTFSWSFSAMLSPSATQLLLIHWEPSLLLFPEHFNIQIFWKRLGKEMHIKYIL